MNQKIDGIFLGFAGSNGFRWYRQFNEYGLKGKINVVGGMTAFDEAVLRNYPHELSGGMRQRVTIALATICRPDFIIADEPTTALDVIVQKNVLDMIREIQREMGSSVLLVTHDLELARRCAQVIRLRNGGRVAE